MNFFGRVIGFHIGLVVPLNLDEKIQTKVTKQIGQYKLPTQGIEEAKNPLA